MGADFSRFGFRNGIFSRFRNIFPFRTGIFSVSGNLFVSEVFFPLLQGFLSPRHKYSSRIAKGLFGFEKDFFPRRIVFLTFRHFSRFQKAYFPLSRCPKCILPLRRGVWQRNCRQKIIPLPKKDPASAPEQQRRKARSKQ